MQADGGSSTGKANKVGAADAANDEWDWGDDDGGDGPALSSQSGKHSSKNKILSIRRPDPKALPSPERAHRTTATATDADPWDDWGDDGGEASRDMAVSADLGTRVSADEEEAVLETEALLREMLQDLVDEDARARFNALLEQEFKFDTFLEYYVSRPDLAEYTMKHELDRMDYKVTWNGTSTSDKLMILSIYQRLVLNDLWRMANQSVYADLVAHLQRAYLSPDVALGVQSTASSFHIDMDSQTLRAEGSFVFTAPTSLETGTKRELGGVVGTVEVDLPRRTARAWIGPPSLRVVFDSDLRYLLHELLYVHI
jgi:hypothetical protein